MSELVGLQKGVPNDEARPHIGFLYTREENDDSKSVAEQGDHPNKYPSTIKSEVGYTSVKFYEESQPYHGPTKNAREWQRQNSCKCSYWGIGLVERMATFIWFVILYYIACSNGLDLTNKQHNAELDSFVQKKSFAQNMMDIALLSANTNQLRYVIDLGDKHPYYMTSLLLIIVSLVMQIVVGLSMVYLNRYNMKDKTEMKAASHMNNLSVAGVFLVTLVNVFISTFNGTT